MKKRNLIPVVIVLFLATCFITNAHGTIITLDTSSNTPRVSARVFRFFDGGATAARTFTSLPFSEVGVTANRSNQSIATAGYDFFSHTDTASFRIDFDLLNNLWPDGSWAAVQTEFGIDKIHITNTSGADIQYLLSGKLEMTSGIQEASLAGGFLTSSSSQNNRFLAAGQMLTINESGILSAGQTGLFSYNALIMYRSQIGGTSAAANGFIELAFSPVSTSNPVPEPATMLLLGTGLAGVAGAARRRKKNKA